jgi:hypothetical protein
MNMVEGDELPVELGKRSMSVGDIIIDMNAQVWLCASFGWTKVELPKR